MPLSTEDVVALVEGQAPLWENYRRARVFCAGGSGFFGKWMLEGLLAANRTFALGARVVVLTRNPAAFARQAPHIAGDPAVEALAGDILSFAAPAGEITHVVHSVVPDAATAYQAPATELQDFFCRGIDRLLVLAADRRARGFLLCSTGAVYSAPDPPRPVREDDPMAQTGQNRVAQYGPIRRSAEVLALGRCHADGVNVKIARGFSFIGPYLPSAGFAAGNFLRDAAAGGPIVVQGTGTDVRSYLYGTDLALALWTILHHGRAGEAYNVGSDQPVTIRELADSIATAAGGGCEVEVRGDPGAGHWPKSYYVPNIDKAGNEFGWQPKVPLAQAVWRSLEFVCRAKV